jgi:hypothetical protein
MNSADSFSLHYDQARAKFGEEAASSGGALDLIRH